MLKHSNILYLKVKSKNIPIDCVCEVGVYFPETSNILDFINEGKKSILVEPDPNNIKKIKYYFSDNKNIELYPLAVFSHKGTLSLSRAGASTFVSMLEKSPAIVNDYYKVEESNNFEVECVTFDEIDNSEIDLLSIDTEGAEWHVLKNMISRPKIVSVETHGKFYTNPNLKKIKQWIKENNYSIWFKTQSDSVFIKNGTFKISSSEKINLYLMNTRLFLTKSKKYIFWPVYFFRARRHRKICTSN